MATLISIATGNFTTAGTWELVDSTSYLDSEVGNTSTTTSYQYSSTFTPGVITVDGIAVKIATRQASPSGTVSVELFNNTGSLSIATGTINATDLPASGLGWQFFKFGSSQLLIAATAYKIGIKTSVSGQATFYRDATGANWSRMLRTTTTQAPAVNDQWHVLGELTGAGTSNSFTVTMDNTATTSFGPVVSGGPPQGATVGNKGTLTWGTSASTNYYLKQKGILAVYEGGTWNMGTSGTRMDSTATAVLEFDSAANVDSGLVLGQVCTANAYGASKQRWTSLTADKAAAATVIALTSTSGWAISDVLAFASTTRTTSQSETKTVSTVDSATQVTLTAGLTNAHTGTGNVAGECGNITSNVKIRGISTSLQGYVTTQTTSTVVFDNVEFYNLGSATTGKRGIDIGTTTGSCTINSCAIHDFTVAQSIGTQMAGGNPNNFTVSNNVYQGGGTQHFAINNSTTGTTWTVSGNLSITSGSTGFTFADIGGTMTNNVAASAGANGFSFTDSNVIGTISGNISHSNTNYGYDIVQSLRGTIATPKCYFNNSGGINFELTKGTPTITNALLFGNSSTNISDATSASGQGVMCDILFTNGVFDSNALTTTTQCAISGGTSLFIFESCTFGATVACTNTFSFVAINAFGRVICRNCTFGEATRVVSQTNMDPDSFILSQRDQQTAGSHKGYFLYGNTTSDTVIYNTASPSIRLTPSNASIKMTSNVPRETSFYAAVANGTTCTPTVYVRKSVAGDGTAYNGNQPRLFVRKNVAAGITADTLLATAAAAAGTWEALSAATASVTDDSILEFYVDCDGTTGWINVDDVTIATATDSTGLKYWRDGLPMSMSNNSSGTGGLSLYSVE